jgi:hypothetical protein
MKHTLIADISKRFCLPVPVNSVGAEAQPAQSRDEIRMRSISESLHGTKYHILPLRLLAAPIRSTLRPTVSGAAKFLLLFRSVLPFASHHFASPIILIDRATP